MYLYLHTDYVRLQIVVQSLQTLEVLHYLYDPHIDVAFVSS